MLKVCKYYIRCINDEKMTLLNQYITSQFTSTRGMGTFRKLKNWYASLGPKKSYDPPYNHIVQIGDPILRRKADHVPLDMIKSDEIKFLVGLMKMLLKKYNCAGISAPQIGIPLRVFLMEFGEEKHKEFSPEIYKIRKMSNVPLSVIINPEMKILNYSKTSFPESCESVKGYCADVPRFSEIEIKGYNENEENIIIKADGWTARIIQHEMDHLDGKLYTDLMDRSTLTCTCWQAVNEHGGKIELPFSPD